MFDHLRFQRIEPLRIGRLIAAQQARARPHRRLIAIGMMGMRRFKRERHAIEKAAAAAGRLDKQPVHRRRERIVDVWAEQLTATFGLEATTARLVAASVIAGSSSVIQRIFSERLDRDEVADLLVVLDAPAAVLHDRRPEHPHAHLERDLRRHQQLAREVPGATVVDASLPAAEVRDRAV